MAYEEFSGELDKPTGFEEFSGKLDSDVPLTSEGRSATPMGEVDPRRVDREPGIIERVTNALPLPIRAAVRGLQGVADSDLVKSIAGPAVSGTLSAPQGLEKAAKGAARRSMNAENTVSDFNPTMGFSVTDTPSDIYGQETDKEKAQRALGVERALASVPSIPGAKALAEYGDKVQKQIEESRSPEIKKAVKESQVTGNIFKGEIDFGSNPSAQGYFYQAVGVLGSMAPMVLTTIVTRSPTAGGVAGGASAAAEGARNAQEAIGQMTDEQLAQASPFFRQMVDGGADPAEARDLTVRKASESAAILQGIVATFGDKFTAKLITEGLGKGALKLAGKSTLGRIGVGTGLSAAEQGGQEVGEGVAADFGLATVLPDTEIGKDSAGNLVLGALGGLGPGALSGARSGSREEPPAPAAPVNFTPADSPSAQAGLAPIVVPVPTAPVNPSTEQQFGLDTLRMGGLDVGTTGAAGSATDGSGNAAGGQPVGGVGTAGSGAAATTGLDGSGRPQGAVANDGSNGIAGSAGGQRTATVAPQNNNAVVQPAEQWFGRKGDGYATEADATQALTGRQRMFPTLDWKIEQMPSGKFRLAGYNTETTSGTQASQAQQAETQGQEAPAAAAPGTAAAAAPQLQSAQPTGLSSATFRAPVLDEATRSTLRLAPQAPMSTVAAVNQALNSDEVASQRANGVPDDQIQELQVSVVSTKDLTDQHRIASVVARMLGKTVTVLRKDSGAAGTELSNGMINKLGGKHIFVAENSDDAPLFIALHEAYHGLPEADRKALNTQLLSVFRNENKGQFLKQFGYTDQQFDEEAPALMAQVISKRADFWDELRTKMGNKEFASVAKLILDKLSTIVSGIRREYGDDFAKRYIADIDKARSLLSDAYAKAMQDQGMQADAQDAVDQPAMSRRGTEKVGDFEVRTMKDGTMVVYGDAEAIRGQIPEDVKGRVTKDGIMFTTAAAPRVKAALGGRTTAYSREGAVLEKLPMKDGKYVGAPEKFNTPGKIPTLRKWLRQLTDEGAPGRYWYENSSREVLKMVGGDVQEARKFVALLAIYSPQAKVDANSTFALRAWAQYKNGQPISVKTGSQDRKATEAMQDVDAFWKGEKTGNFFFNLLREIDPSTEGKQGATIDMWMMRAGQYETDAPSSTQYAFMENETNRLAAELGWEPQQVQAAIWVAMKARMENSGVKKSTEASSEKKGWLRYDYPLKNGKPFKTRVILDAKAHRDNWLKHAFAHDPTKDDTQQAKFDFGDGLKRHIGQVSFEARPGRSTGVLPGIHAAPYAQQVEFQQAVQAAFLDENGNDRLAQLLGLLVDTADVLAPGVWQGEVSPSSQKLMAMAPAKGDAGKSEVDPAQADALNVYAAVAGLVSRQEGVGWHRPFYAGTKRAANGVEIDLGRVVNPAEAADLERAVGDWMQANGKDGWQNKFAFISSPTGIRLVNFGIITNDVLQSEIVKVAEGVLPDFDYRVFASSGDMPTNNWKEYPNGESYVQRVSAAGRSDVLDWARAVLAPRVDRVFADFSERYGWGDAGKLQFSRRARDGSRGQDGRRAETGALEASERAASQEALSALPGAPRVQGFTGPDPRLVSVAEQYARDNGITLRRQAEYVQVDPDRAARIAAAYEAMPHAPNDMRVKAAYKELINQTLAQYRALEKAGYKFWFVDMNQPGNVEYVSTPWNAMRDIRANQTMGVFPTDDGFGSSDFDPASNPLLEDTGIKWPSGSLTGPRKRVLANDLFRAVHDAFGHGLEGAGFRAQGEENAWQAHRRLFKGAAVAAITSETRGQNSWLNYGPFGERNRTAKVEDTVFADQKTGLMPEWTWTEGVVGDMPMRSNRATTPLGFYSALADGVAQLKASALPVVGWKDAIKGMLNKGQVKSDEIQWTGINEWLDLQQGKVTKEQVAEYLNGNGVQVEETVLGGMDTSDLDAYEEPDNSWNIRRISDRSFVMNVRGFENDPEGAIEEAAKRGGAQGTKYAQYGPPGGENYREVLLRLPSDTPAEDRNTAYYRETTQDYKSSHWDEANVLAHLRLDDRTDADGKRVLFIREIQSDWGQDGKKKGFGGPEEIKSLSHPDVTLEKIGNGDTVVSYKGQFVNGWAEGKANEADMLADLNDFIQTKYGRNAIPAAPFVTKTDAWVSLALKRAIIMAAQGGYDKVAIINGEQAADMFDLSKTIQSIGYDPKTQSLEAYDKRRNRVVNESNVTEDKLEDYVGKEVAKRLLSTELVMGKHLLDGEEIKVGGEGMKAFYDSIVPKVAKDVLKKLGGEQIGEIKMLKQDGTKINKSVIKAAAIAYMNGELSPEDFLNDSGLDGVITSDQVDEELGGRYEPGPRQRTVAQNFADKMARLTEGQKRSTQLGFDITPAMREKVEAGVPLFSRRAIKQDAELEQLFTDLQDARGLKAVRVNERVAEHPMASQIEYVNANFYDILEQLDNAGLIAINCK